MKIQKKTRKIKLIKLNDSTELVVALGDTLYTGREITSEADLKGILKSAGDDTVDLLYSATKIDWSNPVDESLIKTADIYIDEDEGDTMPTLSIDGGDGITMSYGNIMKRGLFLITSSEVTGSKNKGVGIVNQLDINREIKKTGQKVSREIMSNAVEEGDSETIKKARNVLSEKGFGSVSKAALSESVKRIKDEDKKDYYKLLKVNEESKDLFLSMRPQERKFFINFLSKEKLYPWKKYYEAMNPDTPMNQNTIYKATRGDGKLSNSNTLGAINDIIEEYEEVVNTDGSYSMAYRILEKSDRGIPYKMLVELLLGEDVNEASIIPYKQVNQKYLDNIGATGKKTIRVDRLVSEKLKSGEWKLSSKSDLTGRSDLKLVLLLEGGNTAAVTSEQTSFLNSELIENNFDISKIVKAEEESRTGGLALTHFDTFEEDIRFYFKLILEEEAVIKFIVEDLKGTDGITADIKRVIVEMVDNKGVVDYTDYLVNAGYNGPAFQKLYKTMMLHNKRG